MPPELMAKARRALASARLLQQAGDADGACNRAYYAMFDAARAVLSARDAGAEVAAARTHSGLIAAFSLRLVKTGTVAAELGRALNRVAELRQAGDYTSLPIPDDKAAWALAQAESFVAAMALLLATDTAGGSDADSAEDS
jgi:uncharacterized protein (UPF0332 family)